MLGVKPVVPALKVVTPPPAGAVDAQVEPLEVRIFPELPGATNRGADVPLPKITLLAVSVVAPVPPFPTGSVPVTLVVKLANVVEVVPVPPEAIGSADPSVKEVKYEAASTTFVPLL